MNTSVVGTLSALMNMRRSVAAPRLDYLGSDVSEDSGMEAQRAEMGGVLTAHKCVMKCHKRQARIQA
jgi:hypothetical protein